MTKIPYSFNSYMQLRILHIMSQMELTGAEVYALALANHQKAQGHDVFIVADELHLSTDAHFQPCPIYDRSYRTRLSNVLFLRRFIEENKIDVVHAHSRAASWIANYALKFKKIPFISTVHGRQHWHGRFKKNDVYGDQVIAVCENIRQHLINEFGLRPGKVLTLGNPIEWLEKRAESPPDEVRISVLGRTTGPKGERAGQFLRSIAPGLLKQFDFLTLQFAGGAFERLPKDVRDNFATLKQQFGERVLFANRHEDFWHTLLSSDLVVASGRIAADSLGRDIPTFAMGEAIVHGFINEKNIEDVLVSNFGDVQAERLRAHPFLAHEISDQLANWITATRQTKLQNLRPKAPESVVKIVRETFDADKIFRKVEQIYRLNIFKKNIKKPIPILMYHKVPEEPLDSKHKIFVTKRNFEAQIRVLKAKGFTSIDFTDLHDFVHGKKNLSEFPKKPILLTFDDGYKDNLQNAFPILREYGFKATLFVLSDFSMKQNDWDLMTDQDEAPHLLMNPEEIKRCQNMGIAIGSHGHSHRNLTELTKEESWAEITKSKQVLETKFEAKILAFAYPFGKHDPLREKQTFEAGYDFAVSTDSGALRFEENPYAIFRVNIFPHDLGFSFLKKISSYYRQYFYWKRGR